MATVIRLKRVGAKKDPSFRIVVADSRARRDGRFVEQLGYYNPQPKDAEFRVDMERAAYWLGVGAKPSDQVRSIFRQAGVRLPAAPTKSPKKAAKPKAAAKKTAAKGKAPAVSAREKARRLRKRADRVARRATRARAVAKAAAVPKAETPA